MRAIVLFAAPLLLAGQDWSAEKEAVLGAGLAREYRSRMGAIESDAASAYLNALAERLRTGDMPRLQLGLVTNEPHGPLPFPAALPGGYIFVPVRLIVDAPDEASFARQLAHSMAHIALGHLRPVPARGGSENAPAIPLTFRGSPCAPGILVPRLLEESRERFEAEAEAQADRLMQSFAEDQRFAALQAELRALEPPRKPPTLRRASEPVRQ